jgi:hypothetical protein
LVGMFGYIFSMSSEANLVYGMWRMLRRSSMNCAEFTMSYVYGRGIYLWIILLRNFANL